MPAYFDTGFAVRQPSWHAQETLLEDYPENWDDARRAAGLMWEPTTAPVFVAGPHSGIGNIQVPGRQAIVRDDTGAVLHVASDSYSVITHGDMGTILDAVLDSDSNIRFETAGSVKDGALVWALVRLDEPYQVPGDDTAIYPFMAMLNAHDGSAACSLTITDIRVVCWNTWQAADDQGERSGARHVFRHTGNVAERIADAKQALVNLRDASAKTRAMFTELAATPVNDDQVRLFTEMFLPSPRDFGEICSDRVAENVAQARATFTGLYDQSLTTDGIRGNAYGLLQASTEYLDHIRGFRNRDSYVGRTILRPEALKVKALGMIREVVLAA